MKHLPMFDPKMVRVLTVRQPWAHLIVTGQKTVENRTWKAAHRGPLYIHAGTAMHAIPIRQIERQFKVRIDEDSLVFGAIIGCVDLVDIVRKSNSKWFEGPYGWVLANPRTMKPIPLTGQIGLFSAPESLVA